MRDEHMKETICLVKKEIAKKAERSRLSFWQFLKTQIRFIGWKIWTMQMIIIGIMCLCMTEFFGKYYMEHSEELPGILMILSIVVLMTAIPFLYRSFRYRMQEVEAVTYASSVRLMMARLFIVAVGDGVTLGSIYVITILYSSIPKMIILLCLSIPFFAVGNGCLFLAGHLKPKYFLHGSIGLCMVMIGLFLHKELWLKILFQSGIYGLLISGLLILLCAYQIWNMQKSSYVELQIS